MILEYRISNALNVFRAFRRNRLNTEEKRPRGFRSAGEGTVCRQYPFAPWDASEGAGTPPRAPRWFELMDNRQVPLPLVFLKMLGLGVRPEAELPRERID